MATPPASEDSPNCGGPRAVLVTRPIGPIELVGLGACLPLGWLLHDLAVLLTSGEPRLAFDVIPGTLAIAAVGALVTPALRFVPRVLLALLVLLALAPLPADWALSEALRTAPRVAALLAIAGTAAAWIGGHTRVGIVRGAIGFGALAAAATSAYRETWTEASWYVLAAAAICLALGFLRRPGPRIALTALTLAGAAAPIVREAWQDDQPRAEEPGDTGRAVPADAPNLLMVVLDTVRADRLASYGGERDTMPALDAFARDHAIRFDQARSTSSWTLPSHASLLTGLLPAEHGATHPRVPGGDRIELGAWDAVPLADDVQTLAERLRDTGYRTGAILSNSVYLNHVYGLDQGFEVYDDRLGGWVGHYLALVQYTGALPRTGHLLYRSAESISDLAIDWIDQHGASPDRARPFFLWLNYNDAHAPYVPPAPFDRAFEPENYPPDPLAPGKAHCSIAYDRELLYMDGQLARVFEHLERADLFDRTVVVVTSDHGEALGQHGFMAHGWTLYDEVIRVPLILKPAGPRDVSTIETPTGGADIHDLALGYLGLEELRRNAVPTVSSEWFQVPDMSRAGRFAEMDLERDLVSWMEPPLKFVVDSRGEVSVYDLRSDPGELSPLEVEEGTATRARQRALEWWAAHPPRNVTGGEPGGGASADMVERLRGLGYGGDDETP